MGLGRPESKRSLAGARGYVLATMMVSAVAIFCALGMAVDIGRMFIAKSETQAFCDSAALSAALRLDGTAGGIAAAQSAVANNANSWNLDSERITSYTLDFAAGPAGPWSTNPGASPGFVYARVQTTVPVSLFFIRFIVPRSSQEVSAKAIAGQIAYTGGFQEGLGPFTVVGPDPSDANFGLVIGDEYDIQWPAYNSSRAGCGPANPDQCFVKPPCDGDSQVSRSLVVSNWGASVNGYWGSNANSVINQEVLNLAQLQPVDPGGYIVMVSGNKSAEATALDTRVNQDGNLLDNDPAAYLASSTKNLRRLIALAIVTPVQVGGAAESYVLGYGSFLLMSDGNPSRFYERSSGNEPFCAVYIGGYTQGGTSGSGTAGYYKVKLVE